MGFLRIKQMNTRAINGKDVLIRAWRDSLLIPFACSTTIDFNYSRELIQKTTVTSGQNREFAYRLGEWGFTLDGITVVKPTSGMYTVFDIMELIQAGNTLDIELSFIDDENNAITIQGRVLMPTTSITSPAEGFSENSMEFKGSGGFTLLRDLVTTDPEEPMEPVLGIREFNYTMSADAATITDSSLINRNLSMVMVDGIGKEIITAGTPNDKQVKYIASTGTLQFSFAYPSGTWVLVLYK